MLGASRSAAARRAQAVISEAGWEQPALRALAGRAAAVAIVPPALMAGLSALESPPRDRLRRRHWPAAPALAARRSRRVVLDRLQDAGNVGTILRSAAAFGFTQVLALKGTAALWSPKVLRAGMGAHFALRLVEGLEADGAGRPARAAAGPPVRTPRRRLHEVDAAVALRLGARPRRAGRFGRRCCGAARWRCAFRSRAARSR